MTIKVGDFTHPIELLRCEVDICSLRKVTVYCAAKQLAGEIRLASTIIN